MSFTGNTQSIENEKRKAKLYTELYNYAAEDFVNYADFAKWMTGLYAYIAKLEARILNLTLVLKTHTHKIAPHIHDILPHVHISASPGQPTSPNILGINTLPNIPVEGLFSTQQPLINWQVSVLPPALINTSGVITNLVNKVSVGASGGLESGELGVQRTRLIKPPILLTPSIPTYISQGAQSAIA